MDEKKKAVSNVVDFIEEHMGEKMGLESIAQKAGYSKFHLNRIFYKQTGSSIYQYIRNRRLTEAAQKLVETDDSISEIALEACYSSQQAFTQAFKQLYGCPPQQYRKEAVFSPKYQVLNLESGQRDAVQSLSFSDIRCSMIGRYAA